MILATTTTQKCIFDKELLEKYHELSKKLSYTDSITFNIFKEETSSSLLDILDGYSFNEREAFLLKTLFYITYKFVEHDYHMAFVRHEEESGVSDEKVHKQETADIDFAYSCLRDLSNLLKMRETNLDKVRIVFDLMDEDNKKISKYQVMLRDKPKNKPKRRRSGIETEMLEEKNNTLVNSVDKKNLIERQIENIIDIMRSFDNVYMGGYRLGGIKNEDLTEEFVRDMLKKVEPLLTRNGKRPSNPKRAFKGVIADVVKRFIRNENLTYRTGEKGDETGVFSEREEKLIAYYMLMSHGLIELDLINSHKDRESRIKYMEDIVKNTYISYSIELT